LIPILSYLFLGRKCSSCKVEISPFYAFFEFFTGVLFGLSYLVFGMSLEFLIALVFLSTLVIVIISDYQTMIISDEVLLFGIITISILIFIKGGFDLLLTSMISGFIAFFFMLAIKLFGDYLFKKESMGGGDIKLMFLFGLYFGYEMAFFAIFLSAFIGLPISLVLLKTKKNNIIPYGPFLSLAAIIITFTKLDIQQLGSYLNWW
jgi:leader peptidase (prepilin peptidase)/N-methyltransferase